MHQKLKQYITRHFKKSEDEYLSESFVLPSTETFQSPQFQRLFDDQSLSHQLYYSTTDDEPFFPFEVYQDDTLIALGYMEEDKQHILYLKHDDEILVEEL